MLLGRQGLLCCRTATQAEATLWLPQLARVQAVRTRFPCHAALKRKGKGDDVTEADMDAVVHAHNSEHLLVWWCLLCISPAVCRD